jgi:spermidine synthase
MPSIFIFFFFSGLCSVLYEVVWLRLAMAQFGATRSLTSIVVSVFMTGLGLGSWGSGLLLRKHGHRLRSPLRVYASLELLIGIGALVVPYELAAGRALLQRIPSFSSGAYYAASGAWLALTLVPWCMCMGATIPVAMCAMRRAHGDSARRSFSFLYLANVLGAITGAIAPLLLIELFGFRSTLVIGAAINVLVSLTASRLRLPAGAAAPAKAAAPASRERRLALSMLFLTGLTCMGLEIIWIRQFTPYLGTVLYAFAVILALYLGATFLGSQIYRRWSRLERHEWPHVWLLLACVAVLPVLAADPLIALPRVVRPMLGIMPFSALLGFLTPMLVDRWSAGDPDLAGRAYALNVLGCTVGPLLSGFVLLPLVSERWAIAALALPWLFIRTERVEHGAWRMPQLAAAAISIATVWLTHDYVAGFDRAIVLRDNTATTIATGDGMDKRLLVNGVGMTGLSPITKRMAHLPLALLNRTPQDALVICFGMGTTFRSLLSWGIPTTAVELVPSVPKLFWYYHGDASSVLASPLAHVVVDDGRRYLERTNAQFDVITIDPPPPLEAAGSSLLATREFFDLANSRLRPGGVFQYWLFGGDDVDRTAIVKSFQESFAYIRAFPFGDASAQLVGSTEPLPTRSAADMARRLPAGAAADLIEWGQAPTAEAAFADILKREIPVRQLTAGAPSTPAMHDDLPINEYYVLRRLASGASLRSVIPTP